MIRALSTALMILAAAPVAAQGSLPASSVDPRLQAVPYDPEQVVRLRVPQGYQTTVIFSPDEQIDTIAVGDSGAWEVAPSARGDHLFVKPLQAGRDTNLTVVTDSRIYSFELTAAPGLAADTPFTVRFLYPDAPAPEGDLASGAVHGYRLSGARGVRPATVTDDGERTYVEWGAAQAIPAVFALDAGNREVLVTGHMRDGRFVIDAVYPTLLFRMDRHVARAERLGTLEER